MEKSGGKAGSRKHTYEWRVAGPKGLLEVSMEFFLTTLLSSSTSRNAHMSLCGRGEVTGESQQYVLSLGHVGEKMFRTPDLTFAFASSFEV